MRYTCLGAAGTVTGSRHLVESGSSRILVDCGLFQEREFASRNWDDFPVDPRSIDAVLLTHAHIDHCGWLPRLVALGFQGPVFCTPVSAEIAPLVLFDAAHLQEEDAAAKTKRHRREGRESPRPIQPLFGDEEVERAMKLVQTIRLGIPVTVAQGLTATFFEAGHVLGSTMIRIVDAQGRSILFSGDLGRRDRPILPDPTDPPASDTVVIEATYGDRRHEDAGDPAGHLAQVVNEAYRAGGALLIPSFAVERAQELIYHLANLRRAGSIPAQPVFLDSPMAAKVLAIFRRHPEACDETWRRILESRDPLDLEGLRIASGREDSKAINYHRGPCIIIAGSGMCTGGRIKHHLFHRIGDPATTVCFVGYQANGTLGRLILEGARRVRILGIDRHVAATVRQIRGFSGHADQEELLAWLGRIKVAPKRVIVVHAGARVAADFAAQVQARLGFVTAPAADGVPTELEISIPG